MNTSALTPPAREEIIAEVSARMDSLADMVRAQHGCLFYAAFTALAIAKRGTRALLQAGSASWLFKSPAKDDGVGPTHYSYVFEPGSMQTALQLARGELPEIHCWAAILGTQEIIDPTTRHLHALCKLALPGEEWSAEAPPAYFWGTAANLPDGWHYEPDARAIAIAFRFLRSGRPEIFAEMQALGITPPLARAERSAA